MQNEYRKKATEQMQEVTEKLKDRLKKVRTGRAHASLLEGLVVSYYGNNSDISHVASVSCPDAHTILISPWDQSALKSIEEALVKSNLGMAPQNDGKSIRLKVPELTKDRRLEIIRHFKKDVEKSRVELRQVRQDLNNDIRKKLKAKQVNEDESKQIEEIIQKQIDLSNKQIDEISQQKEKELIQI